MKERTIAAVMSSALCFSMLFTGCLSIADKPKNETTEDAEDDVVWAEENNVNTTADRRFNIKGFPYYMTDDRMQHCEDYYPVSADMTYNFSSVEVSEPDKYGQVTYTVKYDYDIELCCNDEYTDLASQAEFTKSNAQVLFFNIVDSNSGMIPNSDDLYNYGSSLRLTQIEWGGEKYTIGWKMMHENYWDEWEYFENEEGEFSTIVLHRPVTMTIVAPEGYDGIYLFISKRDDMEYDDERYMDIEAHVWDETDGDISDYYFVKLTDLL